MKIAAYKSKYTGDIFEKRSDLYKHYSDYRAKKKKEEKIIELGSKVVEYRDIPAKKARNFNEFMALSKKYLNKIFEFCHLSNDGRIFVVKPENIYTFDGLKIQKLEVLYVKHRPADIESEYEAFRKDRWNIHFKIEFNKDDLTYGGRLQALRLITGFFAISDTDLSVSSEDIIFLQKGLANFEKVKSKFESFEKKKEEKFIDFTNSDKEVLEFQNKINQKTEEIKNLEQELKALNNKLSSLLNTEAKKIEDSLKNPFKESLKHAKEKLLII